MGCFIRGEGARLGASKGGRMRVKIWKRIEYMGGSKGGGGSVACEGVTPCMHFTSRVYGHVKHGFVVRGGTCGETPVAAPRQGQGKVSSFSCSWPLASLMLTLFARQRCHEKRGL